MKRAGEIITELFRDNFGPEFMENVRQNAQLFSSWERIIAEQWPNTEDSPAVAAHSRIRE